MTTPLDKLPERSSRYRTIVCALVLAAVAGVFCILSIHSGRAERFVPGRNWPATELVSIDEIDHRGWDGLLQRFVDDDGNVDYAAWKDSPADVQSLDDYLGQLSRAEPNQSASRDARLSFWINAYNALTVRGILREYPMTDFQDGRTRPKPFKLWNDLLLHVGSRDYSLGQIEHELLRPMREPRIHFAIVCGSRGCPRLLNRAYQTAELERQLRENSRHFFADPQKLEYDRSTGQLRLSPILKWYTEDFGDSEAEVLETIGPYLPDRVARQRGRAVGLSSRYLDYDWTLNQQPTSPPAPPISP